METSRLSNVIAAARLVENFNEESLKSFKLVLLQQLNYGNESQFLARVLGLFGQQSFISHETSDVLKRKAIEIAQEQHLMNASNNSNVNGKKVSIYQWVQKKCKDKLSRLPQSVITNIGTFLALKESIAIGYLNRQLLIETQKNSYFLTRRQQGSYNDESLIIDEKKAKQICLMSISFPFGYSFPCTIQFGKSGHYYSNSNSNKKNNNYIQRLGNNESFKNIFSHVQSIIINDTRFLHIIPLNLLFSSKNSRLRKYIKQLSINHIKDENDMSNDDDSFVDAMCNNGNFNNILRKKSQKGYNVNQFVNNCTKYFSTMKTKQMKILKIQHLAINIPQQNNSAVRSLCLCLAPICQSLSINDSLLTIESNKDCDTIFHTGLKSLQLSTQGCISVNFGTNRNNNNFKKYQSNDSISMASLEHVAIEMKVKENYSFGFERSEHWVTINTTTAFNSIEKLCQLRLLNKLKCIEFMLSDSEPVYKIDFCQKIGLKDPNFDYSGGGYDEYSPYEVSGDECYENSYNDDYDDGDESDHDNENQDIADHEKKSGKMHLKEMDFDGKTFEMVKNIVSLSKKTGATKTFGNEFTLRFGLKHLSSHLIQFPLILAYFISLKQQMKFDDFNHVKYIEFVWNGDCSKSPMFDAYSGAVTGITKKIANRNLRDIFGCNNSNNNNNTGVRFDADKNIVEYDFDLTEKSCGILYRQVINWFQTKFEKYGESGVKRTTITLRCRMDAPIFM